MVAFDRGGGHGTAVGLLFGIGNSQGRFLEFKNHQGVALNQIDQSGGHVAGHLDEFFRGHAVGKERLKIGRDLSKVTGKLFICRKGGSRLWFCLSIRRFKGLGCGRAGSYKQNAQYEGCNKQQVQSTISHVIFLLVIANIPPNPFWQPVWKLSTSP